MQVKISQAERIIIGAIKSRVVPMLKGSPGCGKSQLIHQIAEQFNLELIDIRLSQCDPTDLAGFPTIEGGKADYAPMKHFPIAGDVLPKGKNGWLLFLDEANSATQAIQAAAYKLVLDRMVGSHKLHQNCAIVLAGNLDTDNAITHELSTAMQSRIMHLELTVDYEEWLAWAEKHGINHRITSFIKFKPGSIYTFNPDHTDSTYACPRTWEFADRLLKVIEPESPDAIAALAGVLSEGVAREFLVFSRLYKDLVTLPEILAAPDLVKVPQEPGVLYALTGSLAQHMTPDNTAKLVAFIRRIPMEFQVVCLREVRRRNPDIIRHPAIIGWAEATSMELF